MYTTSACHAAPGPGESHSLPCDPGGHKRAPATAAFRCRTVDLAGAALPVAESFLTAMPAAQGSTLILKTAISRAVTRLGSDFPDPCHLRDAQFNERMLGHLCTGTPVTDPELLLYMIRRRFPFNKQPELIGVSDRQLTKSLVQQGPRLIALASSRLPDERLKALMSDARLASGFVCQRSFLFPHLPEALKTQRFLAPLLANMLEDKRKDVLRRILHEDVSLALSLTSIQELVWCSPRLVLELPREQVTAELRQIAVLRCLELLKDLQEMTEPDEYQLLCNLAVGASGYALEYLPACERTPIRVETAVAGTTPPHLQDIPVPLRDVNLLRLALRHTSSFQYLSSEDQFDPAFLTEYKLWDALKEKDDWLEYIKEEDRSEALWCAYIDQYPVHVYKSDVPQDLRERHPEWTARLWNPGCYMSLSDQTSCLSRELSGRSGADLASFIEYNSALLHGQFRWPSVEEIPPWALVVEGFWGKLGQQYKDMIWHNGGTEGLGPALGAPAFEVEPEALLDRVQGVHCTLRAARIPAQVTKKLMFCHHFRFPRRALGTELRHKMLAGSRALEKCVEAGNLPCGSQERLASGMPWTHTGGRTLVRTDSEDGVVHMKFQRQGESLATLAAEQTVQQFARDHEELGWQSEIPKPQGMLRVPLDQMPVAPEAFPDKLQVYGEGDNRYCLAFCFTTKDSDYDSLAWQTDETGGDCSKAREGLLRAFHDLGIWSSLGAVHTSTIKLYHHFHELEGARPELLLSNLFQPGQLYPGALHLWNTVATEQSDWGRSGLRDLGDMEFYPFVSAYVEAVDARWIPAGYGQRASFVNGLAQNILGGLLHYMRAHRQLPDYHYKNSQQVNRLAGFLQEACDRYLGSLLADGTRLSQAFPEGVYAQWLYRTAQEIIYWSARQTPTPAAGKEGFAQHFERDGRPCAELYPGHPQLPGVVYGLGHHFVEAGGEKMGVNNSKFPLFFLVRGLYMMAALVADRLAAPEAPQPGAPPQEPMEL